MEVKLESPHGSFTTEARWDSYRDTDILSLYLADTSHGFDEPVAVASVFLPDAGAIQTEAGRPVIAVKDWSENEGMVRSLIDSGVIEPQPCGYPLQSGHVEVSVYPLTPEAVQEVNEVCPHVIESLSVSNEAMLEEVDDILRSGSLIDMEVDGLQQFRDKIAQSMEVLQQCEKESEGISL
jgi:hypothetical protein